MRRFVRYRGSSVEAPAVLDIVERALHSAANEWVFLRELRVGTGMRRTSLQRLDAFALNSLPHTGMRRICYEVKTSRADYLGELKHPLKRRIGTYCAASSGSSTRNGLSRERRTTKIT